MTKKSYIIIALLLIIGITIIASNKTKLGSIQIDNRVQNFNGQQIATDLLFKLNIKEIDDLQHINHWAGYATLDFLPNGTIENLYWEMANENTNGLFDVYQVRYQNDKLNIVNTDTINELENSWGSIFNSLNAYEKLPWNFILNELPTGEKYTAMITDVYEGGQKINLNPHSNRYFFLENGQLIDVNEERFEINTTTHEVTFSVSKKINENFYRGQVEAVIFVPIN